MQRLSAGVRERVLDFLAKYGERGYAVLRAAVDAASSGGGRGVRLGDFSTREVTARLRMEGIEYNPSMLLRILEREYAVIETTYSSRGQHWWRFIDYPAVLEALSAYEAGSEPLGEEEVDDDPLLSLLQVQLAALDIDAVLARLRQLAAKRRLTQRDRLVFRRIVFGPLADAVRVLREAGDEYEELLGGEAEKIREALRLAKAVAARLRAPQPRAAGGVGRRVAAPALLEKGGVE